MSTMQKSGKVFWNADVAINRLGALAAWEAQPEATIITDGTYYAVGYPGNSPLAPGWWQTSPEEEIAREVMSQIGRSMYVPDQRWVQKVQEFLDTKITNEDIEELVSLLASAIAHAETEGRHGRD
jgi:hypothetical protein